MSQPEVLHPVQCKRAACCLPYSADGKNVMSPGRISPSRVPCVTSSGRVLAMIIWYFISQEDSFSEAGISAVESHKGIFVCIVKFALDVLFVHIIRYGIVDIKKCYSILADTGSDELTQCTVDIYLTGYRNSLCRSDGCSHSRVQIQTVSGMQASISRQSLHIFGILCAPRSSLSGSAHTVPVSAGSQAFYCLLPVLLPSLLRLAGILSSPSCLLNASNRSSSEFSSISTPRLYSCLIGALHARKFNGRGPKLMIFKIA